MESSAAKMGGLNTLAETMHLLLYSHLVLGGTVMPYSNFLSDINVELVHQSADLGTQL